MELSLIGIKFYVGRYIYLKRILEHLPDVRICGRGKKTVLTIYEPDKETGSIKRHRFSPSSPRWDDLYGIAKKRARVQEQLDLLLAFWNEDRGGDLDQIASGYLIVSKRHRYDSAFWSTLKSNDSTMQNDYPVYYKDYAMRSEFEVEVAKILDSLGLDYKYEISLLTANGDVIYPDMAVDLSEYDECGFVEAMGGLSNMKYVSHNIWKLREYINLGLYPNQEVAMITSDKKSPISREMIISMLSVMLNYIAEQHVMKL